MKYVDRIIKYLSGEFTGNEQVIFEEELEQDREMQSEYQQIRTINDALEEHYRMEQQVPVNREKLIREIVARHDLSIYGGAPEGDDENHISSLIKSAMTEKKDNKRGKSRSLFNSRLVWIAIAASIAMLIVLFLPDPTSEKLYSQYYEPRSDNTLLQFKESSRGNSHTGVSLYFTGQYQDALEHFRPMINREDVDPYIRLFYALSCIEEDCGDELISILKPEFIVTDDNIELAINWYSSLYLLKKGETKTAVTYLETLAQKDNPYYRKAKRVLRKID